MNRKVKELLKANNIREELISPENMDIFTDMIAYLRVSRLNMYHQEQVRTDLIEMILDGQTRGENIQRVLGENPKEVCDNIITSLPAKTKLETLSESLSLISMCVWIMMIIFFFNDLAISLIKQTPFTINIGWGQFVSTILVTITAIAVTKYICSSSFEVKTKNNHGKSAVLLFIVLFIFMAVIITFTFLLKKTIFSCPVLPYLTVTGILFLLERLISQYTVFDS